MFVAVLGLISAPAMADKPTEQPTCTGGTDAKDKKGDSAAGDKHPVIDSTTTPAK